MPKKPQNSEQLKKDLKKLEKLEKLLKGLTAVSTATEALDSVGQAAESAGDKATEALGPTDKMAAKTQQLHGRITASITALQVLGMTWASVIDKAKKENADFEKSLKSMQKSVGKLAGPTTKGMLTVLTPILDLLADSIRVVADELSKYELLLKGVGAAMGVLLLLLTDLAIQYTITTAKQVAQNVTLSKGIGLRYAEAAATKAAKIAKAAYGKTTAFVTTYLNRENAAKAVEIARNYAGAAATKVASAAKAAYAATTGLLTTYINRANAAKALEIARDYASAAASAAATAANWALTSAKAAAVAVTGTLVSLITSQAVASYASAAASSAASAALWLFSAASSAASTAVGVLTAVWTTFLSMSGIGLVLVLVGAIVALVGALEMTGAIDLSGMFGGLLDQLKQLVPTVGETVTFLKQLVGIGGEPKGMAKWAKRLLGVLFPVLPLVEFVVDHIDDLQRVVENFSLSGLVSGLVPTDLLARVRPMFARAGSSLLDALASGVTAAPGTLLRNAISTALSAVLPFLPSSDAQRGPLSNLTGAGAALVKTIAAGILGAPAAIGGAVLSALSGALGGLGETALSLGSEIAHGIADGIGSAAGAIRGAISGAASVAGGAVDGAASIARDVNGTVSGTAAMAGDVSGAVGAAGQVAGDFAGGIGNAAGDLAGSMLGNASSAGQNNTQIHFHGEVHDAQKIDQKVRKAQRQAVQDATDGIEDALDMGTNAANSLL